MSLHIENANWLFKGLNSQETKLKMYISGVFRADYKQNMCWTQLYIYFGLIWYLWNCNLTILVFSQKGAVVELNQCLILQHLDIKTRVVWPPILVVSVFNINLSTPSILHKDSYFYTYKISWKRNWSQMFIDNVLHSCEWTDKQISVDKDILNGLDFCDESRFMLNGFTNKEN